MRFQLDGESVCGMRLIKDTEKRIVNANLEGLLETIECLLKEGNDQNTIFHFSNTNTEDLKQADME